MRFLALQEPNCSWSWSKSRSRNRSRSRSCCTCSVFVWVFMVTVTVFWLCRVLWRLTLSQQLHKYLNCVPPRDFWFPLCPPLPSTWCAPCVLLAGLFFDSYRFAAPHDAARRRCFSWRWRFILPGSCNSFPKICMRKKEAGGARGWRMEEGWSEAKRHHYIGYALSSLPAYAMPPTPCPTSAPAAAAACHIQHICNMYELCGISLQLALISFFSAS